MGGACARRCCPAWANRSNRLSFRGQLSTVGDLPEFGNQLNMDPSPGSSFLDPLTASKASSDGMSSVGSTEDIFLSMLSEKEFSHAVLSAGIKAGGTARRLEPFVGSVSPRRRPKLPAQNANKISSYRWLEDIFRLITEGEATGAGLDTMRQPQRPATPLFVCAGTCPNTMCGIQAVTYFGLGDGAIDLWWVKPQKSDANELERGTLSLQNRGPLKNDAGGRVRAVYSPLAEKFAGRGTVEGDFSFGVDKASGRAFVEDRAATTAGEGRLLLYLVWQERWNSGVLGKKFIAGKLLYQKSAGAAEGSASVGYFARQYKITNGDLFIAPREEEEEVSSLLPPDSFQEMYDMDV